MFSIRKLIYIPIAILITILMCFSLLNQTKHHQGEVLGVEAVPIFANSYIMSDDTFRNSDVFVDEASIQKYLEAQKSPLQDYWDRGYKASYWIFNAAKGNTSSKYGYFPQLNPAVILAYLEKEQSLISLTNYDTLHDPERRIKTAMGYGCPDNKKCDPEYEGFANQVNWAAFQLQFNYNKAKDKSDGEIYKVGNTITTLDNQQVFLSNAATAANYRYTPHVYWGNYSLWKIIVANGWGQFKQHYYYSEIDNANLNTKTSPAIPIEPTTDRENVQELLKKQFKFGDESEEIRKLQKFLKDKGYFTYPTPTGVYGSWTEASREAYLKDNKISIIPGGKDCNSLYKQNWTVGDTSEAIKDLQTCLKDAGAYSHPSITGYFGNVTSGALQTVLNKNVATNTTQNTTQNIIQINLTSSTSCQDLRLQKWFQGQSSEEVKKLQTCMKDAGYYSYPEGITGTFGTYTKGKLDEWNGAGIVKIVYVSQCDTLKTQTWKVGETSSQIENLQNCMIQAGVFKHQFGATGYFGEVTKNALITWRGYF